MSKDTLGEGRSAEEPDDFLVVITGIFVALMMIPAVLFIWVMLAFVLRIYFTGSYQP